MSEELKAIAGDGFALRVERCCECGVFVSDWVEADHRNGRICRPCESVLSLREQVRKLTEERGVAESRGPMTQENCAACIRSLDSAGMGKPGAPYGNTLTGMVAEACSELTSARQQIEELTAWKTSAIEHWPPVQEIGTVLRLPVGSDANKGILPAVEKLVDKHDALAARCAELEAEVADARTVHKQLASERATALEALAGERRRIELSKATASEVWATHEKQFADQQEKLDAVTARNAVLEKERDEAREIVSSLHSCATDGGHIHTLLKDERACATDAIIASRNRIAELESEAARLREDGAMFDWLELRVVEVREPLVHGSRSLFFATPKEQDGGEDEPSNLRDACRAAIKGK